MDIDFIIPAKAHSERVKNKNWRPFHDGDSLVDVTIKKLISAGAPVSRIHVSSDSVDRLREVSERWGVNTLQRIGLTANSVPLTDWIRSITAQVPGASDVAWCQVCDPMFYEYRQCLEMWPEVRKDHDSLVVCYPWRGYLMTGNQQPVGWSFGEHHTPSQMLPQFHTMPFTFSLLTRSAIKATGYHVGRTPKWHVSNGESVDIDTESDFEFAQLKHRAVIGSTMPRG